MARPVSPSKKIVTLAQAARFARQYQVAGKVVGCISGSFDVMTAIHFKALEERSKKCDVFFVLLNSDSSVRSYKGKAKPILNESERSYLLAQSPFVAHVVIFNELTPVQALEQLRPSVYLNVGEWGRECVEKPAIEKYGGKVVLFDFHEPDTWCKSTSELIKRIQTSEAMQVGKAIFLDRDGVLNENKQGYLYRYEDITWKPHVVSSLKAFAKAGYKLVIVTNQSGIARGYYTENKMRTLHRKMRAYLKEQGVIIDEIYYCPHGLDAGCSCRKPGIGMLLQAATEQNLNLSKSWFIGDSSTDIIAGRHANVHTVYIGDEAAYPSDTLRPNHFVTNLKEAQKRILT